MEKVELGRLVVARGGKVVCGEMVWWQEDERREWRRKERKVGESEWLGYGMGKGGLDGSNLRKMAEGEFVRVMLGGGGKRGKEAKVEEKV